MLEHRGAVEYDFRGLGLDVTKVGGANIGWGEAMRLVELLVRDPASWIRASVEGWEHPVTREALVLMDLFDLEHTVNSKKKPRPHSGRPWKNRTTQKMGDTGGRSPEEIKALLDAARNGRLSELIAAGRVGDVPV